MGKAYLFALGGLAATLVAGCGGDTTWCEPACSPPYDAGPGHNLTAPCAWAPLRCDDRADGYHCERGCEDHLYEMDCSGPHCSCHFDGQSRGTVTGAGGDDTQTKAIMFVEGCEFPGSVTTYGDGGAPTPCVPYGGATFPGGCTWGSVCNGHSYTVVCPPGYPCYCAMDDVYAGDADTLCTEESLSRTYSSQCGFP